VLAVQEQQWPPLWYERKAVKRGKNFPKLLDKCNSVSMLAIMCSKMITTTIGRVFERPMLFI
jgi:hypothetical protein